MSDNNGERRSPDMSGIKTDLAIVKHELSGVQSLLSRLDTAIDKIADVSNGISKILAVHEQAISGLRVDVEERKRLAEKENELLHKRISEMKDESAEIRKEYHDQVMRAIKEMAEDTKEELHELGERVSILEKWKWWVMGGSWAIGFIIATILQVGGLVELLK